MPRAYGIAQPPLDQTMSAILNSLQGSLYTLRLFSSKVKKIMKGANGFRQPNGIDIARSIACFLVVLIHVSGFRFAQFGAGWWASNAYDSMARSSVTVFFMITGALLISRNENIGVFYKKRVIRIAPPILFWSIIYLILFWTSGKPVLDSIFSIIKGPITTHLWYLYAILGLTMFIPFLSKIYKNSSETERLVFLSIWFIISSIIPVFIDLLDMAWSPIRVYGFEPFTGFMGLCFLGAYLYDKKKERGAAWAICNLLGFVGTGILIALSTFWLSVRRGAPSELFYGYTTFLVVISATCLFNFAICLPRLTGVAARIIRVISDCSLGIYCIHPIVIYLATKFWGDALITGWTPLALMATSVFVVSTLTIMIGRLVPIIRSVA